MTISPIKSICIYIFLFLYLIAEARITDSWYRYGKFCSKLFELGKILDKKENLY